MKAGDYVRTKNNGIKKILDIGEICGIKQYLIGKEKYIIDNSIIKSSSNIIDLIEVGDYVNGCLIVEISEDPFIKDQINLWTNVIISEGEPFPNEYYKAKILEKDIKSIVTKEQFESMQYEVK